jgi:hypothetical protein
VSEALQALPAYLWDASLSERELVLPLALVPDALKELALLGCAAAGWEAWLRSRDGKIAHGKTVRGAARLPRLPNEAWEDFTARAHLWIFETSAAEQSEWTSIGDASLYFCLDVVVEAKDESMDS